MQSTLQSSVGTAASEPETEQTDKEGWLCADDYYEAPVADCAKENTTKPVVL